MSRRTKDRPLIRLADLRDDLRAGKDVREWDKPSRNSTTVYELARRGLLETRIQWWSLDVEARITDAGYTLVRGMGD